MRQAVRTAVCGCHSVTQQMCVSCLLCLGIETEAKRVGNSGSRLLLQCSLPFPGFLHTPVWEGWLHPTRESWLQCWPNRGRGVLELGAVPNPPCGDPQPRGTAAAPGIPVSGTRAILVTQKEVSRGQQWPQALHRQGRSRGQVTKGETERRRERGMKEKEGTEGAGKIMGEPLPLPETRWGAGRQSGTGSSNDSPGLYLVFSPGQNTGVWPPRASWSLSSRSISCGCGSPGRPSWRRRAATQRMEMGREAVALAPSISAGTYLLWL